MTRPFDLRAVESAIAGTQFAGHLHHLETIPSTNSLALAVARSGARHGVWIADEQTAGRGRGTHSWHSATGEGLYLSALAAPPISAQSTQHLAFRTAIAVQSAIASVHGFAVRDQIDIRWPNDLMFAGSGAPQRKLGGILIETSAPPATAHGDAILRYAVIGIGVNLNLTAFPPELDAIATSIRRELPQPAAPPRREPLAAAILIALDRELRALTREKQPGLEQGSAGPECNLTHYSSWLEGKRVRVDPNGYTGTTAGLDAQGFLRILADDGSTRTVLCGGLREL